MSISATVVIPNLDQSSTPSAIAGTGGSAAPGISIKTAPADHKHALETHDRAQLDAGLGGGVCAAGRLKLATGPTANDSVTIGGMVFKFVAALGAADATTQILNGTAAQARARLVEAINGTADAGNWQEATAPFAVHVVADALDTDKIRVRSADARGGNAIGSRASVAVVEGLTAAADVWDVANLDETGQPAASKIGIAKIAITAAMITRAEAHVEFPFQPVAFVATVLESNGSSARAVTTDLMTLAADNTSIKIALAGGASPNLQAGDIVTIYATA